MLIEARLAGAPFCNTLTIGRQQLYLHPGEIAELRREALQRGEREAAGFLDRYRPGDYAEEFCRAWLGAQHVTALDYAGHEGAELIHDLNRPVPEDWHARYDAVVDGGSLEHVFHFPIAVASLMAMAKVGGSLFLAVPANNHCGHGFYQFSPELMFRVFAPENGFDPPRVWLVESPYPSPELTRNRRIYEVADPAAVGCRVGLMSGRAAMMLVAARKTAATTPFAAPPLQSDYAAVWRSAAENRAPPVRSAWRTLVSRVYRSLPQSWQNRINGHLQQRRFSLGNRQCYRRRTDC
jgi:hypothetical protein